jgi:DEAD/DEAH box helicase domain-containing protein
MSVSTLLRDWRADPGVTANIVAWRSEPARPGRFAPLPEGLPPLLAAALAGRGIRALYTHQAEAWRHVEAGRHVVVVTGTASGKTLCYDLPVLAGLLEDPQARALYLFPTKALAQDQKDDLSTLLSAVPVAVYDGDTPAPARATIRGKARLVVSNPDMLHAGILPHHTLWADFLRHLRFVVLDEMHTYRGVFGSHVANVMRRLKRVCAFYGTAPRFILTSATIANPVDLAQRLVEEPVALVDEDGSAKGCRHLLLYNPPVVDKALGIRRSALLESVRLAQQSRDHDVQTIVFARSRRGVEIMLRYLSGGPAASPDDADGEADVRGYRGGYLPLQRRAIERGLREGRVRAVVATNALELGVDIGGMGAAVLTGYPGTIAATRQQAGRAGRQTDESVAVLVASADPLDQFLAHHPDYLLGRSPEHALINPDNLLILIHHLRCAAFELPFSGGEGFGRADAAQVAECLDLLHQSGDLHHSGDRYYWMSAQYPADAVSLRSASAETVLLRAGAETIGEVDLVNAARTAHPQAVYLHEGRSFLVDDLDLQTKVASMSPAEVDYYTEPRSETTVRLLDLLGQAPAKGAAKCHGEIAVLTQVTGFRRVRWFTHEDLGSGLVTVPPTELNTTGYWLALDDATVDALRAQGAWRNDANDYGPAWPGRRDAARARDGFLCQSCGKPEAGLPHHVHHKRPFRTFPAADAANDLANLVTLCPACHRRVELAVRVRSGLAGLSYVLGHLAPFFLMCDSRDIGAHSDPRSPLTEGKPAVVIYDQAPAGVGFSRLLFDVHADLVARARELVRDCSCQEGCPSCVGPAGEDGAGGKAETLAILEALT